MSTHSASARWRARFAAASARRLAAAAGIFLVVAGFTACDSTDPAISGVAGTYVLQTVNDSTLPYTEAVSATDRLELLADTLLVQSDGVFLDVTYERDTPASGTATFPIESLGGSIGVAGSTVEFISDGAILATATLNGSTLTLTGNGSTSVYTR